MNFKIKNLIGFIIVLISCYVLMTLVGILTPKIMWLRTILIIIIMILNFTIYYLFMKPKSIIKLNFILVLILIPITIILTIINHTLIHNDFQIRHIILLPTFLIFSMVISMGLYKIILKIKQKLI